MLDQMDIMAACDGARLRLVLSLYGVLLCLGVVTALVLALRLHREAGSWPSRLRAASQRPWTWRDLGTVVLILTGLQAWAAVAIQFARRHDWWPAEAGSAIGPLLVDSVLFHVAGLVLMAAFMYRKRLSWNHAFGSGLQDGRRTLIRGTLGYLALLPILFTVSLVNQGLMSRFGYTPELQEVALLLTEPHTLLVRVYLVTLAIVIAPLFEECLFRGLALPVLLRAAGPGPAVLVVSAVFAGIHFHAPAFLPLFAVAVMFSLAYLYTRSLLVAVVMHGLFNGVNLGLLLALRTG